ncbi:hypothetical protein KEM54_004919 [Ascosphaera aggregata]|nr:hypothetical protein KEM54_004919 [Ascosphaera aggregata]
MLINGEKWACNACIRGHRVSSCSHKDRPLSHVNKKGRPSQSNSHPSSGRNTLRTPSGRKTKLSRGTRDVCACAVTKKCICSAKREAARSLSSSPGPATPASTDGLLVDTPLQSHLVDGETSSRHLSPGPTHDISDLNGAAMLSVVASKATHCHTLGSQGSHNDKYEQYLASQPKVGFGIFGCGSTQSAGDNDCQTQLHVRQWGDDSLSVSTHPLLSPTSSSHAAQPDISILLSPSSLSQDAAEFAHDHIVALAHPPPDLNSLMGEQPSSAAMLNKGRASDASNHFQTHQYTQPSQQSSGRSSTPIASSETSLSLSSFSPVAHLDVSQLSKSLNWTTLDPFQFNADPSYQDIAVPLVSDGSSHLAVPDPASSSCSSQVASSSIDMTPFPGIPNNLICHPQAQTFFMSVPVTTTAYSSTSSASLGPAVANSPSGAADLSIHVGQIPAWNLDMGGEQLHTPVPIDGHVSFEQWY